MKTTIELNGYQVIIEETEGVLTVKAMKEDEEVESFEIDTTEEGEGEGEGVQAFGEGDEDEDFDGEEGEGDEFGDDDFEEGDEPAQEEETKLESFNSFIKKRK